MKPRPLVAPGTDQLQAIEAYYARHAAVYDVTRHYLFGRKALVDTLLRRGRLGSVLEIGCGTGTNLARLAARSPGSELVGLDTSRAMLARAQAKLEPWRDRVRLVHGRFGESNEDLGQFDVVLLSYSLSMMNPPLPIVSGAVARVAPGGAIAVVDYDYTPIRRYARFMAARKVEMRRHLRPLLRQHVAVVEHDATHRALLGAWEYFTFIGRIESKAPRPG